MDIILLIVYALLLVLQIVLTVQSFRNPSQAAWNKLLYHNLRALAIAVVLTILFNSLPGKGPMPGLTWVSETLYSMGAAVVYAVMLVIGLILRMIRK